MDTGRTESRSAPEVDYTRRIASVVAVLAAAGIVAMVALPSPRVEPEAPRPVVVERPAEVPPALPPKVEKPAEDEYDPFKVAHASIGKTVNPLAVIPPMCYTKTEGVSNVCWVCHTQPVKPNGMDDAALQEKFDFPTAAARNRWKNLFKDRTREIAEISDEESLRYVRADNYAALRAALAASREYDGYVADLDFAAGFDDEGFARDGSGWRAIRYKPFPGAFWPTNGSTDDVMVRLPERFRTDAQGQRSREAYRVNLAILEATITADPAKPDEALACRVEPLDETVAAVDLDGDGKVGGRIDTIRGLPKAYVGGAAGVPVHRYLYPLDTEFLHSVRYLDPDAPSMRATRMKELRYSRKESYLTPGELEKGYADLMAAEEAERAEEGEEEEEEDFPAFHGLPQTGYANGFGWRLQGFIEDEQGRLRLQTEEEQLFCMGCHSGVGVTVDFTFAMARKLPGAAGWRYQDLRGIPDAPQAGHAEPEVLEYFRRANGGDEFRGNEELLARFFPGGRLAEDEVRRAAVGGDRDLAWLLLPSAARAIALNKAYMALVRGQRFDLGRDPVARPAANVFFEVVKGETTGLKEANRTYADGRLWLDWEAGR